MIKIRKLNCGATMIMDKTDYLRSASLGIWVKSGSYYEKDEESGISHFIEHMMFKGTSTKTAREIAESVDRIGGSFNAFTGKEATCYYIKTLSSSISKGAEILIDMITDSIFDSEEMDKERKVILEEIKMVSDTPDDEVIEMISKLVNSGNPYKNSVLGTPDSLAGIDRDLMVSYYMRRYARNNIVISVTGNFDEEEIARLFEDRFMCLEEKEEVITHTVGPYKQQFAVKDKDIEQTHICLAAPGISLDDERIYTFSLLNNIFGGSMSSRLFQKIREEKGLAYSVCSINGFQSFGGFFAIYAGVAHENARETIDAINEEWKKFAEEGPTEDELHMAKEQMKSSYIFGLENPSSRMISIGKNQLLLGEVLSQDEVLRGYDSVTTEDITAAVRTIGDLSTFCGAAVTNGELDIEGIIRNEN